MKGKIFLLFRLLVTAAILFALFKLIPYEKLVSVYRDSKRGYLALGFFIFFLCLIINIFRWRFLLSSLGVNISIREAFYAYFCGLFLNLFFPSFVAGDVFRSFCISRRHGDTGKVASSVLMDRFSGAIALIIVALCAFIFGRSIVPSEGVTIALLFLCVIAGFSSLAIFSKSFFRFLARAFKRRPRLEEKLISFHDKLYFFKRNPKVFAKSFFFSLPIQLLMPTGFFVISRAFDVNLGALYFFIVVPIVTVVALIPITIAGAGTREASAVYFFSLVGIEKSIGLGISLLNLIFLISMGIIGGIFYVSVYHKWLHSHPQGSKP